MQIAPGFSEPNSPDPKARGEKRIKKGAKENEKEIQAEYIAKMHALASTLEEEIKHLKGKEVDQKILDEVRRETLEAYGAQISAYYSTSELWDDGILDPVDTRNALGIAIASSLNAPFGDVGNGVLRF